MGVDACIFAKNAKRCLYFDRVRNLITSWDDVDLSDIVARLRTPDGVPAEDVRRLAETNIQHWCEPDDAHRRRWNQRILQFIEQYPGDRYFVVTDHSDPGCWMVIEEGGYVMEPELR